LKGLKNLKITRIWVMTASEEVKHQMHSIIWQAIGFSHPNLSVFF
jgi:hypothetical protein